VSYAIKAKNLCSRLAPRPRDSLTRCLTRLGLLPSVYARAGAAASDPSNQGILPLTPEELEREAAQQRRFITLDLRRRICGLTQPSAVHLHSRGLDYSALHALAVLAAHPVAVDQGAAAGGVAPAGDVFRASATAAQMRANKAVCSA
jgi:hypothetical protein